MNPFETVIKDLAEVTGLPLQVEADDSCSLESNDMIITIQYMREQDNVVIYAPVMVPEEEERLPYGVLRKALEFSYEGKGTHNAFLGMLNGALILSVSLPMTGLDADSLAVRILAFTDTAQDISQELESILNTEGGFERQNKDASEENGAMNRNMIFHV
jgi:hypothetical protein